MYKKIYFKYCFDESLSFDICFKWEIKDLFHALMKVHTVVTTNTWQNNGKTQGITNIALMYKTWV